MNFWSRHIGDLIRDTVSLSMLEDGAYNRLLDQYYQTERPLPLDKKLVYRLARATSAAERRAVDFVLETFFDAHDDGYHQKRCDVEIAAYQQKQRKAQASANARWSKSEGNANAHANASGDKRKEPDSQTENASPNLVRRNLERNSDGIRPDDPQIRESLTQQQNVDANASKPHDAPDMRTHCEGNASHKPEANNQIEPSVPDGTDADASPPGMSSKDAIFHVALPWLTTRGVADKSARSLLGGAIKQLGDEGAWALAQDCIREGPLEPAAWIAGALNARMPTSKGRKSRHNGFDQIDYREGIANDGSF
ncbi:YdaU family protein [Burkholderia stagnalis]|uniref:YdaU family protein n=1 Tax=Burkholderia stagnalis TaxID=1503054 RepID=UPI0021AB2D02|nr:YdaU family protein [Burkholderia stagnalis]